ncbi:MAG: hypothetical protein RRA92_08615 [Gemmatimonadota bacterium]|nr:hypothetical protein [Gemmatimonadota bacterium]
MLLPPLLVACGRWVPMELPAPGAGWDGDAWKVRVTETDGTKWLLSDFEMRGDTLEGGGYDVEEATDRQHRRARAVAIAREDIQLAEQRKERPFAEIGLSVAVALAAIAITVAILD